MKDEFVELPVKILRLASAMRCTPHDAMTPHRVDLHRSCTLPEQNRTTLTLFAGVSQRGAAVCLIGNLSLQSRDLVMTSQ